eukprot:3524232-Prymnesium_polylepis.1
MAHLLALIVLGGEALDELVGQRRQDDAQRARRIRDQPLPHTARRLPHGPRARRCAQVTCGLRGCPAWRSHGMPRVAVTWGAP